MQPPREGTTSKILHP
ncbi:hypothetical protein Pint_05999 [Pistacia integerrima]|uniref:Uncharacterized protein n=2 Tax=Pistacia TaxID=55512 RepID=A0ACC1BWW3_9ROSI|nr:hypothetical protein Pint_05999 [Pistacia integerrima]KAJ0103626.1 hypothetical protein Patl1_06048 [Pistacia atlantica]